MYIDRHEIGYFESIKIRIKNRKGLFTRKMVFCPTKYFGLIDKIIADASLTAIIRIHSNTGREYTVEQFINNLEYCDEIRK